MVGKRVTVATPRPRLAAVLVGLAVLALPQQGRALVATPSSPEALAAAQAAGPVSTAATGARCVGSSFDDTAAFQAAIDTGHTVYAPALGGQCHITHALIMRTPGQIFYGDGRARTKIVVEPGFTGDGVFVAKTGEPGPVWRDFSVSFVQPDTDERAKLYQYPPAFFTQTTPRFEMEHLGCYAALTCIDMTGNSGGSTIADFQMSAFDIGIDIDGSLDTVRISDLHWYPFNLTVAQRAAFSGSTHCPVGILIGRMDDIIIAGSLFGGCKGIVFSHTSKGFATGSVAESDFDTYSGIYAEAGNIIVNGCHFSLGTPTAQAIKISGGVMQVSASLFLVGADLHSATIANVGAADFELRDNTFLLGSRDITVFLQTGGVGTIDGNTLLNEKGTRNPLIVHSGGELAILANRLVTVNRSAEGVFLKSIASNKAALIYSGNMTGAWKIER